MREQEELEWLHTEKTETTPLRDDVLDSAYRESGLLCPLRHWRDHRLRRPHDGGVTQKHQNRIRSKIMTIKAIRMFDGGFISQPFVFGGEDGKRDGGFPYAREM